MKKKIFILFLLTLLTFACGKKGDPIFKKENQSSGVINTQNKIYS